MKRLFLAIVIASCAIVQISCKFDNKPTTAEPTVQAPTTSSS
ncbi:hypothetical protein [Aquirhabdus sp.]